MECKTTKKGAVELKIRILITLGNYSQAMLFVDSLKESDFTFRYKKNAMYKNLLAMSNGLKGDTVNQNRIYKEMADDLEKYIRNKNVQGKEFEEIFIDLYTIKDHFLNTKQINIEIDSLKKTYTSKIAFFDFFKK